MAVQIIWQPHLALATVEHRCHLQAKIFAPWHLRLIGAAKVRAEAREPNTAAVDCRWTVGEDDIQLLLHGDAAGSNVGVRTNRLVSIFANNYKVVPATTNHQRSELSDKSILIRIIL